MNIPIALPWKQTHCYVQLYVKYYKFRNEVTTEMSGLLKCTVNLILCDRNPVGFVVHEVL